MFRPNLEISTRGERSSKNQPERRSMSRRWSIVKFGWTCPTHSSGSFRAVADGVVRDADRPDLARFLRLLELEVGVDVLPRHGPVDEVEIEVVRPEVAWRRATRKMTRAARRGAATLGERYPRRLTRALPRGATRRRGVPARRTNESQSALPSLLPCFLPSFVGPRRTRGGTRRSGRGRRSGPGRRRRSRPARRGGATLATVARLLARLDSTRLDSTPLECPSCSGERPSISRGDLALEASAFFEASNHPRAAPSRWLTLLAM